MSGHSRLLRACLSQPPDMTPVWFLQQASRYLPQYRAVRDQMPLLEVLQRPALACALTLQPVSLLDVDGAVIFTDPLLPLISMGLRVEYTRSDRPIVEQPLISARDIDRLQTPPALSSMPHLYETIRLAVAELATRAIPVVGLAAAPFSLASVAIEPQTGRGGEITKSVMYTEPSAWRRLMTKLVAVTSDNLREQAAAGAQLLCLLDPLLGLLSPRDHAKFVASYTAQVLADARTANVPVIYYSASTSGFLGSIAALGSDVVAIDWRVTIDEAWKQIDPKQAIQGNLDPALLLGTWRDVRQHVDDILAQAAGRPGHIFSLGGGILPGTRVELVRRLIDYVHEQTTTATHTTPHLRQTRPRLSGVHHSRQIVNLDLAEHDPLHARRK